MHKTSWVDYCCGGSPDPRFFDSLKSPRYRPPPICMLGSSGAKLRCAFASADLNVDLT